MIVADICVFFIKLVENFKSNKTNSMKFIKLKILFNT